MLAPLRTMFAVPAAVLVKTNPPVFVIGPEKVKVLPALLVIVRVPITLTALVKEAVCAVMFDSPKLPLIVTKLPKVRELLQPIKPPLSVSLAFVPPNEVLPETMTVPALSVSPPPLTWLP